MGNILPDNVVSALSVALFGMFLAVIVPQSRKDKKVLAAVAASFACSYASSVVPAFRDLSAGTRTIILTVSISAFFALVFPRDDGEGDVVSGVTAPEEGGAA